MEYVAGKRIDQYCEGLAVRQKIELFLKVCAAWSICTRTIWCTGT